MVRRKPLATYEMDFDRVNEHLIQRGEAPKIQDRDSYDLAYDDYMGTPSDSAERGFRDGAFKEYVDDHPQVSLERIFTKAKGKDLTRDRRKTAKRVVTTRKEYIKQTAPRVDLRGYDTAQQRVTKEQVIRRTFTIPARRKGRVVFAMRIKNKRGIVQHKDSKGVFVSVKLKK